MIYDALKYESKLFSLPIGWIRHFNKNAEGLNKKYIVDNLGSFEANLMGSPLIQGVLEDVIELNPPNITKYLSTDFHYLYSEADDLIDEDDKNIRIFEEIFRNPGKNSREEWRLVDDLAVYLKNSMGGKYDDFKEMIPKSVKFLNLEKDAKTKKEAMTAAEEIGDICGEICVKLAEIYSDKEADGDLRRAGKIAFIIGNYLDDLGDIEEDWGKKNTYATLRYNELRKNFPKPRAKELLEYEFDEICNSLDKEGLELARNKDAYRLLRNIISMKFNVGKKKILRNL